MYQKSPFPYLILFAVIIGSSCFSNATINKKIEKPIVHRIFNSQIENHSINTRKIEVLKDSIQLASIQ